MALVCRIKQSKLKTLSNQFKRYYFQIPGPCSFNHTVSGTKLWVLDQPDQAIYRNQFNFCNNARFFAAPVQAKPKQEEKDTNGPRLNEKITAEFVRLVVDEGHRVVSRHEALERAKRLQLDLVEVQPERKAKPPVCKLMDYNKERYKQQIKDKDRAKSRAELSLKSDCKEVRFTGKIEQKDLQMKADMAKRLLERGYRVKCHAMGTADQDLEGVLFRLYDLIEDIAIVESAPDKDKMGAHVMLRHVRFGPSKRGSGKKVSKGKDQKLSTLSTEDVIHSASSEDVIHSASSEIPDKALEKNKSTWSDFHATDDFDQFDFSDDLNSIAESSIDDQIKAVPEAKSSPPSIFSEFLGPKPVLDCIKENAVPSSRLEGARDSTRLDPRSTNQRMQPQDFNFSPSAKPKRVETDTSLFRNGGFSADEIPKQEPSRPRAPSSAPSHFGIFSSPKPNDFPGKGDLPAEDNGYKNEKPFNSDGSQRPGIDKDGQRSWGIFSREKSNVVSNRTSESQADSQR